MKKLLITAILLAALTVGCSNTDVVANTAIKSFESLISSNANAVASDKEDGFSLLSPGKTEQLEFGSEIAIEFDKAPFVNAGLDPAKLPDSIAVVGDKLRISMKNNGYAKQPTASAAFEQLVRNNRDAIGYHSALDHYGIKLGNGNMFEWAKDLSTNDKDMVFVLNPQPFIDAGVDVNKVEGWLFAKVETMENGKTVQVDKLLKQYNIK